MANIGAVHIHTEKLWDEPVFWELFSKSKEEIFCEMESGCGTYSEHIPAKQELNVLLRKYTADDLIALGWDTKFVENPEGKFGSHITLNINDPDSLKTHARYTTNECPAWIITAMLPERRVDVQWFIDGCGDYGSYWLLGSQIYDVKEGNLCEDLMKDDAFSELAEEDIEPSVSVFAVVDEETLFASKNKDDAEYPF